MERIPTYVQNLDSVLNGGLPKNSTVLISGVPGSGKTILANQIVYGNATPENRALIITTVSEPLARMVYFTQRFSFFDPEKVGRAVIYENVGPKLLEGNGEDVLAYVTELVMKYQPAFLIIDSFKSIHDLSVSRAALRRAMYRFAATLSALSCTSLLVSECEYNELANAPEAAIVDGIIELTNRPIGLRDRRSLRVRKLRGSDYLAGDHAIRISADGISVFPRFVSPPTPEPYVVSRERVATGIPGLDNLLHGGLLRGTSTLVAGDPGVGKTVTALHFLLNGAVAGEPGAYISFQEDPNQLNQIAQNFGFDPAALRAQGVLAMFYTSPVELDVDEHVLKIIDLVERIGARRVVIDSISDFEAGTAFDHDRYFNFVYSLTQWFKDRGITSMLTTEIGQMFSNPVALTGRGISHIADTALLMRYTAVGARVRRVLTVLKVRGSAHSNDVREYLISEEEGPRVGGPMPGVLSLFTM